MSEFTVTNVIDGDTFEVFPHWKFHEETGDRVRIANLDAPEIETVSGKIAHLDLQRRLLNKQVKLTGKAFSYGRLVADVELI